MALKIERVDTWVAALVDKPGSLAGKFNALSTGGVNLGFVIARRAAEKPGKGVVFAAPIQGPKGTRAARTAGFKKTKSLHTVRVEGPDKRGQGAKLTQAVAAAGINLRGLSGAGMGKKFVSYLAFDTASDASKAVRALRALR
jgi:hypothetical protein